MSISGDLQEFSIIDVLQYLHASQKSGILQVECENEEGKIVVQNGQILRASFPSMRNLGTILVDSFDVSQGDLTKAVEVQKSQTDKQPLGKILVESNVLTHGTLKEAMFQQIEEAMDRLLSWESGSFRFEPSESVALDDIQAKPDDLILPEEANAQLIILDAVRQFDEKRRDEAEEPLEETEPLSAEPVLLSPESDTGLSLALLKMMLREVGVSMRSRDITLEFLNVLSEHVHRAILFVKRQNELVGIGGFGSNRKGQSLRDIAKQCSIEISPNELPQKQIVSRDFFHGPPPKEPWVDRLYEKIGSPRNPNCLLFSVAGMEQFVCWVYADNDEDESPIHQLDLIEIAGGQTGLIIENRFLRKKLRHFQKRMAKST